MSSPIPTTLDELRACPTPREAAAALFRQQLRLLRDGVTNLYREGIDSPERRNSLGATHQPLGQLLEVVAGLPPGARESTLRLVEQALTTLEQSTLMLLAGVTADFPEDVSNPLGDHLVNYELTLQVMEGTQEVGRWITNVDRREFLGGEYSAFLDYLNMR